MYAYIKGCLVEVEKDHTIIDVGGRGFFIYTPMHFFLSAPNIGSQVLLHTSFIVSQDNMRLFGFLKKQEKMLFEKLITISGLGPKTALAILSYGDRLDLAKVIRENDVQTLTKIPGIGNKTAQRIIIELSDKLGDLSHVGAPPMTLDAIAALISLGYKEKEATKSVHDAMKGSKETVTLSELISLALSKYIAL